MGLLAFLGLLPARGQLETGAAAPAVKALTHEGREIDVAEVAAKGLTLFFFYPKADTPGCTKQACSLRDASDQLAKAGVKVFGVSFDAVAAQKAFAEKFSLPYPLLADPDGKVVAAFGVPASGTFAKRQAFLFKDGKLVWRDLAAATDRQAADVLAAVAALAGGG
jgi:thioredoxin-dependent peroxiredoxin